MRFSTLLGFGLIAVDSALAAPPACHKLPALVSRLLGTRVTTRTAELRITVTETPAPDTTTVFVNGTEAGLATGLRLGAVNASTTETAAAFATETGPALAAQTVAVNSTGTSSAAVATTDTETVFETQTELTTETHTFNTTMSTTEFEVAFATETETVNVTMSTTETEFALATEWSTVNTTTATTETETVLVTETDTTNVTVTVALIESVNATASTTETVTVTDAANATATETVLTTEVTTVGVNATAFSTGVSSTAETDNVSATRSGASAATGATTAEDSASPQPTFNIVGANPPIRGESLQGPDVVFGPSSTGTSPPLNFTLLADGRLREAGSFNYLCASFQQNGGSATTPAPLAICGATGSGNGMPTNYLVCEVTGGLLNCSVRVSACTGEEPLDCADSGVTVDRFLVQDSGDDDGVFNTFIAIGNPPADPPYERVNFGAQPI
ncbi:hypothetical protein F66182_5672 [Fusarium sp. NRRL 66182]|nr:hypothetical protein F66182_5672 [Fusarium sp. NRRL 66182]